MIGKGLKKPFILLYLKPKQDFLSLTEKLFWCILFLQYLKAFL